MIVRANSSGEPTEKEVATAEPLLWTPAEVARSLAISPRKLWAMTAASEIPCVRLGRAVRYDPADLRDWIDQQKAACRR